MMDRQAAPEREPTSSVHPRGKEAKEKALKHAAQAPVNPSLDDQATPRVKAFMWGQNEADYCGDIKIVEGDESGQYRRRK